MPAQDLRLAAFYVKTSVTLVVGAPSRLAVERPPSILRHKCSTAWKHLRQLGGWMVLFLMQELRCDCSTLPGYDFDTIDAPVAARYGAWQLFEPVKPDIIRAGIILIAYLCRMPKDSSEEIIALRKILKESNQTSFGKMNKKKPKDVPALHEVIVKKTVGSKSKPRSKKKSGK